MTRVIGLTGGIASGKSLVAKTFQACGFPVLDADQMVRTLSAPGGKAESAITSLFGTSDRAKLRVLIFSDAKARADLEGILHPLLKEALSEELARLKHPPIAIYEAALLVETGRYHELNGLIVVTAPLTVRIQRLIKRDGLSEDQALRILDVQTSDESRLRVADFHLVNHGNEAEIEAQVRKLATELSNR